MHTLESVPVVGACQKAPVMDGSDELHAQIKPLSAYRRGRLVRIYVLSTSNGIFMKVVEDLLIGEDISIRICLRARAVKCI